MSVIKPQGKYDSITLCILKSIYGSDKAKTIYYISYRYKSIKYVYNKKKVI